MHGPKPWHGVHLGVVMFDLWCRALRGFFLINVVIVFLSSNEISVFQRQRSSTLLSQRQAAVPMSSHASTSQPDLRFAQTTIEDQCLNSPPFSEQIGLVVIWTKLSMTDAEELRLFERFGSGQCLAYADPSRWCFTACLSRATCSISSTCVLLMGTG